MVPESGFRPAQLLHRNSFCFESYNRMEMERPPDPGNRDLDTSSTEDKINAYDAVASSHRDGIQPAIFLTHSFL